MLPILFHPRGRPCLVVGAGPVGLRKSRAILDAGGLVRLVAPNAPLELLSDRVQVLRQAYLPEQLSQVILVFAAATQEVNSRVVTDARERGILVSSASDPDSGDFTLPAILRQGELTIAVSTGGASPLIAAAIRDQMATHFDDSFADWLDLLKELRQLIQDRIADSSHRRELYQLLADFRYVDRLRQVGRTSLRDELLTLVKEQANR